MRLRLIQTALMLSLSIASDKRRLPYYSAFRYDGATT
nr:MAG TPA: hypothetical protein [Caudoviricetes sp.]